jgi:hypothetical protein
VYVPCLGSMISCYGTGSVFGTADIDPRIRILNISI